MSHAISQNLPQKPMESSSSAEPIAKTTKRKPSAPPDSSQEPAAKISKISPDLVVQKIASQFGITRAQLRQGREAVDLMSKNICIYILNSCLHLSEANIAEYFGLQSSVVASSIQQIKRNIQTNHLGVITGLKYWATVQSSFTKKAIEGQTKAAPVSSSAPISESIAAQPAGEEPALPNAPVILFDVRVRELPSAANNFQVAEEEPPQELGQAASNLQPAGEEPALQALPPYLQELRWTTTNEQLEPRSAISICQNNPNPPEFGANLHVEQAIPETDSSDWEDLLSLENLGE